MIKNIYNKIFNSGHQRSIKAKKNIAANFIIQGVSILVSFFSVRIIIDYLGKEQYGIWIVLTSFLTWYSFFELGLGNGLRNKLSEALAKNDFSKAKEYVSTTYFLITIIALTCLSVFLILNRYINWNLVLNTKLISSSKLYVLTNIIFGFFFVQFVLNILMKILYADQKPALVSLFYPIISIIQLLLILWLGVFSEENIVYVGLIFSLTPVIIYLIGSVILFKFFYSKIKPSYKNINLKLSKDLLDLGLNFFIIGIGNLFILQLSNVLITQFYGPNEVTTYNVAFKLFTIPTMIVTIISSPLWSAYTEAWSKNDISWIKQSILKMKYFLLFMYLFMILLLVFYQEIIDLWIKEDILIPFSLALILFINSFYSNFGRIHLQFTNGISKLKVQLIATIIGSILIIPLSYLFCVVLDFGLWGITLAIMLSNIKYVFAYVQYKKIINNSAIGLWNK